MLVREPCFVMNYFFFYRVTMKLKKLVSLCTVLVELSGVLIAMLKQRKTSTGTGQLCVHMQRCCSWEWRGRNKAWLGNVMVSWLISFPALAAANVTILWSWLNRHLAGGICFCPDKRRHEVTIRIIITMYVGKWKVFLLYFSYFSNLIIWFYQLLRQQSEKNQQDYLEY